MYCQKKKMRRKYTAALLVSTLTLLISPLYVTANETLTYNIEAGSDDAEENNDGTGVLDIESSDIELTYDIESSKDQTIGLRFNNIDVPQGTTIVEAYIQFTTDEDDNNVDPFSVTIWAEATDDAEGYEDEAFNISSRATTDSSTTWSDIAEWTVANESGDDQQTPDLAEIIQEVIDREGWEDGNSISFVMQGEGTRSAESYEGSQSHISVADYAAHLVIVLPSTETYTISDSSNDAEEGDDGDGIMDLSSSDLELVEDHEGTEQHVGLRFTSVNIPAGAEILSASIQFAVDEADKNVSPFNVTIYGQADDDAAIFEDSLYNISSREKTESQVSWDDIADWTVTSEAGEDQQTPDLTDIIQEIVSRDGWEDGNSMAFIFNGNGTRTAEAFDGDSDLAPSLEITFIGDSTSVDIADKVRLSWSDDPATTMDIIWDQLHEDQTSVYYDLYSESEGCLSDVTDYENTSLPTRSITYSGMENKIAELTNLSADTAYRFIIANDDGSNECSWFRTAPNTQQAFTFISGGDTKNSGDELTAGRWSNEMVAKLRPLFVLFTGDFNSGDGTDDDYWSQWLTDWSTMTRSDDGRQYPILPIHGNHEDGDMEMLYQLFNTGNSDAAQDSNYAYRSLSFGNNLLKFISLNSQLYLNGYTDEHDIQSEWLEQELASSSESEFIVAGYHKPIRPHTSSKSENDFLLSWATLFDSYDVTMVFESDSHVHKFTYPISVSEEAEDDTGFVRDDDNGVLYVGEGSWGASPRDDDDDKSWTLDSASINQVKWVQVFPATDSSVATMEIRTVKTAEYVDSVLTNYVEDSAANTEDDVFAIPEGISLYDTPYYGTVIDIPFKAVEGDAPVAPSSLVGSSTSYTEIEISWVFSGDESSTSTIEIDRKQGDSEDWSTVTTLDPSETEYTDSNLSSGTTYYYRVRATNIFGESEWSEEIQVSTLVDSRLQAQFQVDLNDYSNSQTLLVTESSTDETISDSELSISTSTRDYGRRPGESQALIVFNELFGEDGIPDDVTIDSAELRFWTTDASSGPISLHQMYEEWDDTVTWDSLSEGVTTDDVQANSTGDDSQSDISSDGTITFDVTATITSLQNGQENYGWAIINSGNDGWDINTELYDEDSATEQRFPKLTVYYTLEGDIDGSGIIDTSDMTSLQQYIGEDAEACSACDLNDDGTISMADLRLLMLVIRGQ